MAAQDRRYEIELKPSAAAELAKFPRKVRERIAARINALTAIPRPPGSKKLEGEDETYRIRVGDYRILYQVRDEVLLILVVRIAHRKDVYRNL
ncbi:MAG: type II toxin-antitoxin system RelE family toxin [Isosphaeraceae bacterium]